MTYKFLELASTPSVRAVQEANGSRRMWEDIDTDRAFDRFGDAERSFIAARDSFYVATVSEDGWPYVQHRGGPPGFLQVLDDTTLAFADFRGNRQYFTVGNLAANDRAALILVDYPNRKRLKVLAHVEARSVGDDPATAARLALPGYRAKAERSILLRLETFDWNCPQHITPRFTAAELEPIIAPIVAPLRARLADLERENRELETRIRATQPQDASLTER